MRILFWEIAWLHVKNHFNFSSHEHIDSNIQLLSWCSAHKKKHSIPNLCILSKALETKETIFKFLKDFYFVLFYVYKHFACTKSTPGVWWGQEMVPDPLEQEL